MDINNSIKRVAAGVDEAAAAAKTAADSAGATAGRAGSRAASAAPAWADGAVDAVRSAKSMTLSVVRAGMGIGAASLDRDVMRLTRELDGVKASLASVEVEVKSLLKAIEDQRSKENAEQERVKTAEEFAQAMRDNIQKMLDAMAAMREALL